MMSRASNNPAGGFSPRQKEVTAQLEGLKKRIERGDPIAIYEAILFVSENNVKMPDWFVQQLLTTVSSYHLGKKPGWKGAGNKPVIVIRRRIERDIKRRAVSGVRAWIKNAEAYNEMPKRCIQAWFTQEQYRSQCKTSEDAYDFASFGLRGERIMAGGPTIKCSPRTLRRAFEDKQHKEMPAVRSRIATVFGFIDPDDLFGTDEPPPKHLK